MAITKATASSIAPAAKGDLVVGSGTNDAAVLAVGTNDYVLTAASGETTGLKWAAPSSTVTFSGVDVRKTTSQSISNATFTLLTWNSEEYDTSSYHDNSTNNSRLTVPTTGYYLITGVIDVAANATGNRLLEIRKNGAGGQISYLFSVPPTTAANGFVPQMSYTLKLTAADYIEAYFYQNSGGSLNVDNGSKWQLSFLGV